MAGKKEHKGKSAGNRPDRPGFEEREGGERSVSSRISHGIETAGDTVEELAQKIQDSKLADSALQILESVGDAIAQIAREGRKQFDNVRDAFQGEGGDAGGSDSSLSGTPTSKTGTSKGKSGGV